MLDLGYGISEIAQDLGYCYVTIYKELERCGSQEDYNPYYAQSIYEKKSKKKGRIDKLSFEITKENEIVMKNVLVNAQSP